jgi:anti-anti-sigma factor
MALPSKHSPFKVEIGLDSVVVRFIGDDVALTEVTLPELGNRLDSIAAIVGRRELVLDLSAVDFLTSAPLGTLIRLHRVMQSQGGGLTLCGLRAHVYEVFLVTRLASFFTIRSTPLPDSG